MKSELEIRTEIIRSKIKRPKPMFRRLSSHWCICGKKKENPDQRYCRKCGVIHGKISSQAHRRKGLGLRKAHSTNALKEVPRCY